MEVTWTITGVGVLDKGVALLDVVERQPMTVSELSRELGMTLTTCHRLTTALTSHKLLRRDDEGRFHLGHRFTTSSLVEVGTPVLRELRDETGETVQLWVRRGDARLVVLSVDSEHELRAAMPVGSQVPLSEGGSAALVLQAVRPAQGHAAASAWAESVATRTPGLGSVSAPVHQHGDVLAAVCLVAPLARLRHSPGVDYGDRVLAAARRLEAGLPQ